MKKHIWTADDDNKLKQAVDDCKVIFEHYGKDQNKQYGESNAWDAVAGRLLPEICVTGVACKKRFATIEEQKKDAWKDTIDIVDRYERELAETTFDGVAELLGHVDALHDKIDKLIEMWEPEK